MKLLSLILDHLLVCVFLSLLWGTTDSTTTITATVTTVTAGQQSTAKTETSTRLTTNLQTATTRKPTPLDPTTQKTSPLTQTTQNFTSLAQKIQSFTSLAPKLRNASSLAQKIQSSTPVAPTTQKFTPLDPTTQNITPPASKLQNNTLLAQTSPTPLTSTEQTTISTTTKAPPNNTEEFKAFDQNETSITLMWKAVPNIDNYLLEFNGREITISNSTKEYTFSDLTSGTRYTFTLFTVFGNVNSSGVNCIAVTAPRNAEEFKAVDQNETSITLMWKAVPNIDNYLLVFNGREINISNSKKEYTFSDLTSGTRYTFTLFAVFGNVSSSGVNCIAVTVPAVVPWVSVTERFTDSITLEWKNMNKAWQYELQINGHVSDVSSDTIRKVVTSLQPGTKYDFSLTTVFAGLRSTPYTSFTVTAIDCASADWKVTNSSIKAKIEGLFSNATAQYGSNVYVSDGRENVSFTGLYPGATYNISLVYEKSSRVFLQCEHKLTILPPNLNAHCEYWAAGYSVLIKWTDPEGEWTNAEVNVTEKTHTVASPETKIIINGSQPAKKYKVSVTSLSGVRRSSEPHVFYCQTDPRGSFVLRLFRHLVVFSPYCVSTGLLLSIYWSRKTANKPDVSMEMNKCDGEGDELNEDYDDVTVLGTEHDF